jgi:hypothetical protein
MRAKRVGVVAGVVLALSALALTRPPVAAQSGFSGRLEVRQVELAYRPGSDALRVRVHLISGMAVEHDARGADVDRILDMIRLFSPGRSHMFVELEADAIRSFQVSVP